MKSLLRDLVLLLLLFFCLFLLLLLLLLLLTYFIAFFTQIGTRARRAKRAPLCISFNAFFVLYAECFFIVVFICVCRDVSDFVLNAECFFILVSVLVGISIKCTCKHTHIPDCLNDFIFPRASRSVVSQVYVKVYLKNSP